MIGNRTMVTLVNVMKLPKLSYLELAIKTTDSIDGVYKELQSINDILDEHNLPTIILQENGYEVPIELIREEKHIYELFYASNIRFNLEDRLEIIFLYTFMRNDFVSNFHYQELLHVSKNTVLNDLKALREHCEMYSIEFKYTRSIGYHIVGEEINKHRLALHCISDLLSKSLGQWSFQYILEELQEKNSYKEILRMVDEFANRHNMSPMDNKLSSIVYLINFIFIRAKRTGLVSDKNVSYKETIKTPLRHLAEVVVESYSPRQSEDDQSKDIQYIELLLLGGFEGSPKLYNKYFNNLTLKIVEEMESISVVKFEDRTELINGLYKHLVPAYYRLESGHVDTNKNSYQIKTEYAYLYDIVERALQPLQKEFENKIPDSEISYFVIHFGGYLYQSETIENNKVNALIICPNGVSSSLIIKRQLENIFPNMTFLEKHRSDQIDQIDEEEYDLIFSTIPIESAKPVFVVSLFMKSKELSELRRMVEDKFPTVIEFSDKIEELVRIIELNAEVRNEFELKKTLNEYFKIEEGGYPMLSDLITKDTYQKTDEKMDWEEAIHFASKPLLDSGRIENRYVDAMINRVKEYGPFIDLGKGIAIPHARPEDGVNEVSMSMLVLDNPVYLLDRKEHEINIIVVIAAVDNKTHLDALSHLTVLIREDENIEAMKNIKSFDEMKNLIESK